MAVALALALAAALAGCTGDPLTEDFGAPKTVQVSSTAFPEGTTIPSVYTCSGRDVSPPLRIGDLPRGTTHLALIMDDPDAPRGTWTHWTFWDLPAHNLALAEGANVTKAEAREGTTSFGDAGYGGPCPPPGGPHRYFFKVYALGAPLGLAPGADRAALERALDGNVLAYGSLMGLYAR